MTKKMKIAGISGGLSKNAISRKILNEGKKYLNDSSDFVEIFYGDLPVYNQDIEYPAPESIVRIREQLKDSDGIMFVIPEYNLSIPGGFKNLLDWLSRPVIKGDPKPLFNYPVLVLSLSAGVSGGMVAQESVRSILSYLGASVMSQPRASFPMVFGSLDSNFELSLNEVSTNFLKASVTSFNEFVLKFHSEVK